MASNQPTTPHNWIPRPPSRPPVRSLLIDAPRLDAQGQRWQDGWRVLPDRLQASQGIEAAVCIGPREKPLYEVDAPVPAFSGDVYNVWAREQRSTLDYQTADYAGRMLRRLEAQRSYLLAQELWVGTVAAAEPLLNQSLANGPSVTVTTAPTEPWKALAKLEGYLRLIISGHIGMIHMTPDCLTALMHNQVLVQSGTSWVTPNGHVVIADAGYPGTGPGDPDSIPGATQWMYATPMIHVLWGEPDFTPELDGGQFPPGALNRDTNTVELFVSQLFGLVPEGEPAYNAAGAAEVDLVPFHF